MRLRETIQVHANFWMRCTERGKYVPGTLREGHNVFTTVGREWLAKLCGWQTIGSPDIAFTNKRVRWVNVGTGTQAETVNVSALVTPSLITATEYLAEIDEVQFPTTGQARFIKEFSPQEISIPSQPVVAITEAGLIVDLYPVSTAGGTLDSAAPGVDTIQDPTASVHPLVAYHSFAPVNKTPDYGLEIRWEFRFA
jgi:hypothetical protein